MVRGGAYAVSCSFSEVSNNIQSILLSTSFGGSWSLYRIVGGNDAAVGTCILQHVSSNEVFFLGEESRCYNEILDISRVAHLVDDIKSDIDSNLVIESSILIGSLDSTVKQYIIRNYGFGMLVCTDIK